MRVIGVVSDWGGCAWYRTANPLINLAERGHDVEYITDYIRYDADVMLIPRISTNQSITMLRAAQAFGKKVVLDFDDNYHEIPMWSPCFEEFNRDNAVKIFEMALKEADIVSCSTESLAGYYRDRRDDIHVARNFMWSKHLDAVAPKPEQLRGEPKRPGEIRIGYVGSYVHLHDISSIRAALEEICKRYSNVKLVSLCQQFVLGGDFPEERVEAHQPVQIGKDETLAEMMFRYYSTIRDLDLDIGLAPLLDNPHNASKSNIRLLEYGVAGVPVVASKFGPYADDNFPILQATDTDNWVKALEILIDAPYIRGELAQRNIEHIRENWTEAKQLPAWEAALGSKEVARV